jgi:hypothetical protein
MFKATRFEQVPLAVVKKVVEREIEAERSESGQQVYKDNLKRLEQILAASQTDRGKA